ncbi:MAG: hypothetical protein D6812_10770 [Deltaproteobacteria bacterium]|nr:MAG: hypothetical protein D6812_10770 [Deltaproteobacteria bacterium]
MLRILGIRDFQQILAPVAISPGAATSNIGSVHDDNRWKEIVPVSPEGIPPDARFRPEEGERAP